MKQLHFIHLPKNAGMSIRKNKHLHKTRNIVLSGTKELDPTYVKNFKAAMRAAGEHDATEHARWIDLTPQAKQRQAFAIIRNPWSRIVSRYLYMMKVVEHKIGNHHLYKQMPFEEFLELRFKYGNMPYFWGRAINNWYPQKDHVVDKQGNLRVDVIRLERYRDDMERYLQTDKLIYQNVSNGEASEDRQKVNNRRDYKAFYNEKTIQEIADWYKDDIEFFGFDFDTAATRNTFYQDN